MWVLGFNSVLSPLRNTSESDSSALSNNILSESRTAHGCKVADPKAKKTNPPAHKMDESVINTLCQLLLVS